jgi:hypothetical protein
MTIIGPIKEFIGGVLPTVLVERRSSEEEAEGPTDLTGFGNQKRVDMIPIPKVIQEEKTKKRTSRRKIEFCSFPVPLLPLDPNISRRRDHDEWKAIAIMWWH